jgi:hypothetical protein
MLLKNISLISFKYTYLLKIYWYLYSNTYIHNLTLLFFDHGKGMETKLNSVQNPSGVTAHNTFHSTIYKNPK